MSTVQVMQTIRETELKAEEIRREAVSKAREMIKNAEGEALLAERRNAMEIRSQVTQYQAEKDAAVSKEILAIARQESMRHDVMRSDAAARIENAGAWIVERILTNGDH